MNQIAFRVASVKDSEEMVDWLIAEILSDEQKNKAIRELVYQRFRQLQLEPLTKPQVERLIKSAVAKYETDFAEQILDKLTLENTKQKESLLSGYCIVFLRDDLIFMNNEMPLLSI